MEQQAITRKIANLDFGARIRGSRAGETPSRIRVLQSTATQQRNSRNADFLFRAACELSSGSFDGAPAAQRAGSASSKRPPIQRLSAHVLEKLER
jgi:hypothetical protein